MRVMITCVVRISPLSESLLLHVTHEWITLVCRVIQLEMGLQVSTKLVILLETEYFVGTFLWM